MPCLACLPIMMMLLFESMMLLLLAAERRLTLAPPFKAGKPLVVAVRVPEGRLSVPVPDGYPNTCFGSYAMLCRLRKAKNSSSNVLVR